MHRSRNSWTLALVAALLFAGMASADPNKPKKPHPQQTTPTGAEDSPQAPVASPAVMQALEQMLSRSSEGLVEVEHADGSVSMDLEGRFMSVMFASPAADGGQGSSCHTGHDSLKQAQAKLQTKTQTTAIPAPLAPTTAPLELQ